MNFENLSEFHFQQNLSEIEATHEQFLNSWQEFLDIAYTNCPSDVNQSLEVAKNRMKMMGLVYQTMCSMRSTDEDREICALWFDKIMETVALMIESLKEVDDDEP